MAQHLLKTSFSNGEITPLAGQRQDLELYRRSLARLYNWYVLKHGGVRRRSGTRFRGLAKFANQATRLISYTFSIGQSYVLEFGNLYMRVWVPEGLVVSSGVTPYELVTPYPASAVNDIQVAPYNDAIYAAHSSYFPQLFTRILANSWTVGNATFLDGPYMATNVIAANTVNVGAVALSTGLTPTFTWSAGSVALNASDIGRHVRVLVAGKWSWGTITSVPTALTAVMLIRNGQGGSGVATSWRLGAFYVGNYPRSVTFFEDRLCYGGTPAQPRSVFISASGTPSTFSPSDVDGTVSDANGMSFELSRSDPILWLKESTRLLIGTASGVRSIGGSSGAALTARNVTQKLEVSVGTAGLVPEQAAQSTVLVGRTSRRINNLYYDYQVNGLVAPELSILSEHLYKQRVVATAYQETPDGILWSATATGKLVAMTLEQSEEVKGFSSHDVGGQVQSIAVMRPEESDQLWACVRRTINGAQVQYIETLEQPFDQDVTDPKDAFMVDCGATYSGAATNTISGATWLANEVVQILADGARLPDVTVSAGGVVTLPNGRTATKVQFGKAIPNQIVTLEAPSEADDGSAVGRRKKAISVIAKMLSAQGVKIGALGKPLQLVVFRNSTAPLGVALPLNTGSFKVPVEDSFDGEAKVEVSVEGPFPATILALNIDVESEP